MIFPCNIVTQVRLCTYMLDVRFASRCARYATKAPRRARGRAGGCWTNERARIAEHHHQLTMREWVTQKNIVMYAVLRFFCQIVMICAFGEHKVVLLLAFIAKAGGKYRA